MLRVTKQAIKLIADIAPPLCCFVAFILAPVFQNKDATTRDQPHQESNLLAPSNYVLGVWPIVTVSFLLNHYTSVGLTESPSEEASLEAAADSAVAIFVSGSCMLFGTYYVYLAPVALVVMWYDVLTFYQELKTRNHWHRCSAKLIGFTLGGLSVRLTLVWITGAVVFSVIDLLQFVHGECFSFQVYAKLMGILLAVAVGVYVHTRDPIVAWMTTWFIVGLATRKTSYVGETKETFEKLQAAAVIVAPLFFVVLVVDIIQGVYNFVDKFVPRSRTSTSSDERSSTAATPATERCEVSLTKCLNMAILLVNY